MTTAYTWTISQLDRTIPDNGVVVAHWLVAAVDGEFTASAYGTVSFSPDPNAPTFIPYEKLTQDEVLKWVWGSVDKDATEASLAVQIDEEKNPKTATGLPW